MNAPFKKTVTACAVALFTFLSLAASVAEAAAPKPFSSFITVDKNYKGEIVAVIPPKEIQTYIELVKKNAKKNPEWFKEYSKNSKPGVPLPFHENLGLTPLQYKEYRALWAKREFKPVQKVGLRMEAIGDKWRILVTGQGAPISLLRFDAKKDVIVSPNGTLKRIENIDADVDTILGAWTGAEWKFEEKTGLGKTKENLAIGNTKDKKFGYLVYRLQDITTTNRIMHDRSMVIRFPLK